MVCCEYIINYIHKFDIFSCHVSIVFSKIQKIYLKRSVDM